MIRSYSHRLLPPYSGVVQIAESERARAQSFDGLNWEIQYFSGNEKSATKAFRMQGYGLDKGYFNVGSIQKNELKTFNFPACVDHDAVATSIGELHEYIGNADLPFSAADCYEYWLLDRADESPLALLYACCEESAMNTYPGQAEWTALPQSKMHIENTDSEKAKNEPPVNHRFQRLIAGRAGNNPRAAWFKRSEADSADFPTLLVREDWQNKNDHELCQRYLLRKASRLLMLDRLTTDDRERLEIAAKRHVFEVEQYYPLYPAINDENRMAAMRVEAQLRRTAPQASKQPGQQKPKGPAPLDRDMRIIEN